MKQEKSKFIREILVLKKMSEIKLNDTKKTLAEIREEAEEFVNQKK